MCYLNQLKLHSLACNLLSGLCHSEVRGRYEQEDKSTRDEAEQASICIQGPLAAMEVQGVLPQIYTYSQ